MAARARSDGDGRVERGNQTRRLILKRSVDTASVEGLEGLSLGRLAAELQLSKSGVFALFGSKVDLQLATVRAAIAIYVEHVVLPPHELPPGLGRLWRVCTSWLRYSRGRVFPGGCFFYAVSAEYDAREGPVHEALAAARADWTGFLERTVREAQRVGEVRAEVDGPQLVFEMIALMELANAESVMHGDDGYYDKATKGIITRLRDAAVDPTLLPEASSPSDVG
ncbi:MULTISPECIES: TetR/AcrR family transcriptional regulator [Actinoalloteichus]|uniref:Transcriptional regulator, TetR family n=1 Tax=Actinoalloteichus fjordicus TaxID=1612552 RepID=A0AAC9PSZ2_9PSEU|nr:MULTISPECIES: TetR/AcrR family transcriptional regulator [Actinoalloteichus]APU15502.1 transcriptional regulator, TetR family [Actinoalloteichus fjordicus]APU21568.1 transcriptional regulator, TetR family [Actinoalloteichus sp. GBA129-24]